MIFLSNDLLNNVPYLKYKILTIPLYLYLDNRFCLNFLELQRKAAVLLGKEDALFISSGTMGNLIASKIRDDFCTSSLKINVKRQILSSFNKL